jgi:hypothetical protein
LISRFHYAQFMTDTFLTFKTFSDTETAEDFAEVLRQNDIPYFIEEDALVFDPSYANNQFNKDYRLKLKQEDFERADKALQDYYHSQMDKVDKDYYLFEFSDEELQEIIAKPDEWGDLDYQLAQKLLADRGKPIKPQETQELKDKRLDELSRPGAVKRSSIIWGYIVCFFFFPGGLFMGWNWAYSKKTLPNGQRVYMYDQYGRKHGRNIFAMGIILLVLSLVFTIIDL